MLGFLLMLLLPAVFQGDKNRIKFLEKPNFTFSFRQTFLFLKSNKATKDE